MKLASSLSILEQEFSFLTGSELTGWNIKKRDDDWLIVIKATKGGKHFVAFVGVNSLAEAFDVPMAIIGGNALSWVPDKFVN